MQAAIHTCLDNGRVEIVREALEAQWRVRSNEWSESSGPKLLTLECGPSDEPAECGICFEALHQAPGIFVSEKGFRACQHFTCLECAEHVQDEASDRLRIWRMRRDPRIPQPPGPVCPMCRATFAQAARLTDPTMDPRTFFRLACVPQEGEGVEDLRLNDKIVPSVLSALLPINVMQFTPILEKELWPTWCKDASSPNALAEADFLRPGGMLAWLSDHLLEMKVEGVRGGPPPLQENPEKWFRHFDYNGKGVLSKPEVLRGIAKAYDVSALANPETPARRARSEGIQRLRNIVDAIWDDSTWQNGVPLAEFLDKGGLAERILTALPPPEASDEHAVAKRTSSVTVEEALARVRAADMKRCEDDQTRAKERAEKQKLAASTLPMTRNARRAGSVRADQPGRAGAELLLASLLEAAREGQRGTVQAPIRIQCPFCGAVNQARAAAGHRVICGGCRSVFAVPAGAGLTAAAAAAAAAAGGR
mmetsp:Transcript_6930/g.18354  ORF Transcript_6930/g.18354 Transcript_6930/m.18354 type:complete len:478 (+) Transcript_6930:1-1434(+)